MFLPSKSLNDRSLGPKCLSNSNGQMKARCNLLNLAKVVEMVNQCYDGMEIGCCVSSC